MRLDKTFSHLKIKTVPHGTATKGTNLSMNYNFSAVLKFNIIMWDTVAASFSI